MLRRVAAHRGPPLLIVPVPLLTPRLSSRWLSLVTDVDVQTGRSLVDSMTNEVVVRDDSIRTLVPFEPMGYDDAVLPPSANERQRPPMTGPAGRVPRARPSALSVVDSIGDDGDGKIAAQPRTTVLVVATTGGLRRSQRALDRAAGLTRRGRTSPGGAARAPVRWSTACAAGEPQPAHHRGGCAGLHRGRPPRPAGRKQHLLPPMWGATSPMNRPSAPFGARRGELA